MAYSDGNVLFDNDANALVDGIKGNGVVSGCAVTAQGTPDDTVAVAAGYVVANGTYVAVVGINKTCVAHATLPLRAIITVSSAGVVTITHGTATAAVPTGEVGPNTSEPNPPDIPANEIQLADIWVEPLSTHNPTTIVTADITDRRIILANYLPKTGGTMIGNIDFAQYKAIAMVCDNGTTFPAAPVQGQWFLYTGGDPWNVLCQYTGTAWAYIINFSNMAIYVDKAAVGTANGTSWANAFTTITAAWAIVPKIQPMAVTIHARRTKAVIQVCSDKTQWTAGAHTALANNTTDVRVGTSCIQGTVTTAGVEILATCNTLAISNLSTYTDIVFWFMSSIVLAANDFQLRFYNAGGLIGAETLNMPAFAAGKWQRVSLKLTTPASLSAITKIEIYQAVDKADLIFHIDHIEASYIYREMVTVSARYNIGTAIIRGEFYAGGACAANVNAGKLVKVGAFAGWGTAMDGAIVVLFDCNGAGGAAQNYYVTSILARDSDDQVSIGTAWRASDGTYVAITPTTSWYFAVVDVEVSGSDNGITATRASCFTISKLDKINVYGFLTTLSSSYAYEVSNARDSTTYYFVIVNCVGGFDVVKSGRLDTWYGLVDVTLYGYFAGSYGYVGAAYVGIDCGTGGGTIGVYAYRMGAAIIQRFYIRQAVKGLYTANESWLGVEYVTISNLTATGLVTASNSVINTAVFINNATIPTNCEYGNLNYDYLTLKETALTITSAAGYGRLYILAADHDLYYITNGGAAEKISASYLVIMWDKVTRKVIMAWLVHGIEDLSIVGNTLKVYNNTYDLTKVSYGVYPKQDCRIQEQYITGYDPENMPIYANRVIDQTIDQMKLIPMLADKMERFQFDSYARVKALESKVEELKAMAK